MKYLTPKYEIAVVETEDALTVSLDISTDDPSGFEISKTDEGDGKIKLFFSKLYE